MNEFSFFFYYLFTGKQTALIIYIDIYRENVTRNDKQTNKRKKFNGLTNKRKYFAKKIFCFEREREREIGNVLIALNLTCKFLLKKERTMSNSGGCFLPLILILIHSRFGP